MEDKKENIEYENDDETGGYGSSDHEHSICNIKEYRIIIYTVLALLMNLGGRLLAQKLVLPVCLDSVGTFTMAYAAGPVCGAIVGFTNSIIYGIYAEQQTVYCIVGALLGMVVGWCGRKKVFDTQFQTMTLGMCLAVFSTVVTVLINTLLYGGMTGNVWANQVMLLCVDNGLSKYLSNLFGQFCVEVLDKLLCVELVYLLIYCSKYKKEFIGSKTKKTGALLLFVTIGVLAGSDSVMAAPKPIDYNSYVQKVYSNAEGLLSGEANDIEQTRDGTLWIGTYAGLFKYDGKKFRLFQDIPSVKNVNCLYTDEEGRLWVGTNDNGVTIFTNEQVMSVIDEESGLLSNTVKNIVCDANGNYYLGTSEGISMVTLDNGIKIKKSFEQMKNVIHMAADQKGNVAVITDRGELRWITNGEFTTVPFDVAEVLSFDAVCFTEDEELYLTTKDNVIMVFDMSVSKPYLDTTFRLEGIDEINSFYATERQEVFVCSNTGVTVIEKGGYTQKINTNSFTSSIENMLVDYQGNLWFTSSRLGLLELCPSPFSELFTEVGDKIVVNTTEQWLGYLFCGTDERLIILDEEKNSKVENELTELLSGARVLCIKRDSKNQLWIATTGMGIYKIRAKSEKSFEIKHITEEEGLPGMRFRHICELTDGRIAVAGDYGVAIFEKDKVVQVYSSQDGLVNEKSLCLLEHENTYYIGSDGGGITKIQNDQIVGTIEKKDGLSSNVILRMVYDSFSDGIFIVTSNGLCYMSADGTISSLDQFPYNNDFDIICTDSGTSWILSSAGIYVAGTKELIKNERQDYPLLNAKSGLRASLVANSWLCKDGDNLYLCCDSGVVKVNMLQCNSRAKSYRMVLRHVEIDGKKHEINRVDTIRLSANMERIVFEPKALNYSVYDPYVSVRLIGYDTKETICLLSELDKFSYSNLKSGKYTFRISILDGMEGNVLESASYNIEKEVEMYQNWWFKVYVTFIASLVLVWITWFITRVQAQKTLLKQQYELEYAKKQIKMGNQTILSIARTVDAKDSNTSEHSFRVSEYSVAIARRLNYSEEKCENLRQMALLHDIGKIGIPDAILNKPSRLTDEEYEIMKSHVIRGGEILKDFTLIDNVSVGALYHHEKYDGTGYCHGLKGEEIPLDARIIGVADAFDAMTANRVYRNQLDIEYVISELKRCSGTQFDPKLVKIMLSLIEDGTINVENLYEKSKEGSVR